MPGVKRYGYKKIIEYLGPLVKIGLKSIIIFGIMTNDDGKDAKGTYADHPNGPVIKGIKVKYFTLKFNKI